MPFTWDDKEQIARARSPPEPSYWLSKIIWLKNSGLMHHIHILTLDIPGDHGGFPVKQVVEAQSVLDELPDLVHGCINLQALHLSIELGASIYPTLLKISAALEARTGPPLKLKIACSAESDSEDWANSLSRISNNVDRDCIVRLSSRVGGLDIVSGLRYMKKQDAHRFASNVCCFIARAGNLRSLRLSLEDGEIDQELRILSNEGPQNLRSLSL